MKLKKIASLMLAGIMAVSMLAGCNGEPAQDPDDNGNGGVTVTGHSVDMGKALKDLDCIKDKDYITFADNAADQAALQKAVDTVDAEALADYAEIRDVKSISNEEAGADFHGTTSERMAKAFVSAAELSDDDVKPGDLAMAWYAGYGTATDGASKFINTLAKDGALYVVNGDVTTEQAVLMVADEVEEILKNSANALPKTNAKPSDATKGYTSWNYNYTISVSVVDKALQSNFSGAANSVHFIAVTVSRTATNA